MAQKNAAAHSQYANLSLGHEAGTNEISYCTTCKSARIATEHDSIPKMPRIRRTQEKYVHSSSFRALSVGTCSDAATCKHGTARVESRADALRDGRELSARLRLVKVVRPSFVRSWPRRGAAADGAKWKIDARNGLLW
eukprot:2447274-Pleurochrysis_carterae.AAC.4